MKRINAVTCYSLKGFRDSGPLLIKSFIDNWPSEVELTVYVDEPIPKNELIRDPRIEYKILDQPNLLEFKKRHLKKLEAHGLGKHAKDGKENFRFNAVKFSHKVFALIEFINRRGTDTLIWLDGDTRTHSRIELNDIESWCPEGKFAGYLARPWMYTETGFHIFNMNHPIAKDFFSDWKNLYANDTLFENKDGTTDCHTYDTAKQNYAENHWFNLSPPFKNNHPFINGPLGNFMDHMKGPRKTKGTSHRTDLVIKTDNPYWKGIK